ncbi:TonB-dependent receptor [Niabella beijingensis]|uniref:TonB-dependent receptor n=1 Tax=Niabella beijingensis TaxID=2872700 RepID=UPI001CC0197A|nr:TonB-dependent receptor [Niabella beijingensis]MBZ4190539.1 TonB-dependent receptor [Niabella beijingensis]
MKQFIYTVLATFLLANVQAQTIKGKVAATNGNPIEAATISILNTGKTTITDKYGNFSFANIAPGTYQLSISLVGFAKQLKVITVNAGIETKINFTLSEESKQLDEVVVTADKVETNLQKTPIAVTALNAKQLEQYRVWTISDLTALAPSTFIVEHGNSIGSNFINIRGAMGFANDQSVATYVDGVYQFDYFSAPLNFNNIERVEILRGPQGTLYGRNAYSGVLNIITKKPVNKMTGFAEIDFGNYRQQRYSAGFNTPLIKDKLFVNAGLQSNGRGSVYSNPTLNTKNFDQHNAYSGNVNLKYLASDKWTIDWNTRYENDKDKGAYPWAATDSMARANPYTAFGNWDNTERRTNFNTSLAIKYFGSNFNFTSITALVDYHIWFPGRFDFDFTPDQLISGKNWTKENELTQEFRFSSPANAGKWKWTAGSFLFGERLKNGNNTYFDQDYALYDPNAPYASISNGKRKSYGVAFYGQATYSIAPKLDVTAGARYDIEHRELTQNSASEKDGTVTPLTADSTAKKTFNAFTPKIILSYKLTENSMVYSSYAKGFRVGGFNFGNPAYPTYNPEKSDNYEIGVKNNLFNNRLKINLTAFYFQQKDQQVSTSKDGINYATLNVGDMNNYGLELETSVLPFKNLQIDWTASTSHSEYKKLELFDAATNAVKDYKGNKAINNPALQSMLAVQYGIPFSKSAQTFKAFIRGEFRYTGEYQLDFTNSYHQGAYGMLNARAGVTSNHLDIALWIRNLNDVRYMAYGYGSYMMGSPRMWGVTITGKF